MKSSVTPFIYTFFIVLAMAVFCPNTQAAQTDGDAKKTTVKKTRKTGQADETRVESKEEKDKPTQEEKVFEAWGDESDSGSASKPEPKTDTGSEPHPVAKPTAKPELDDTSGSSSAKPKTDGGKKNNQLSPRTKPQHPPQVPPHPMDAHKKQMNNSFPKPPPAGYESKAFAENDKSQETTPPPASRKRFKRYDIGVATGFGAGATDSFSRATSVIWKVSGEFFFDHVGISPFILADKGRDLTHDGLTFFVSLGVQLKYRFLTDEVFQPYVSAGAALAFNSGKFKDDGTAGPVAGVGALIKLNDIFYLHFDSFVLVPMDSKTSDDSEQYVELGDLLFVATSGAAVLF